MRKLLSIITSLVFATMVAYATTSLTYKFDSGTAIPLDGLERDVRYHAPRVCGDDPGWWSVGTYYDGVLVEVDGIDCSGKHYTKFPETKKLAADPLAGETPTFTDIGTNGGEWYVLVRYDALHRVIWEGGKDAGGSFWETAAITYDEGNVGPGDGIR